MSKKIAESYLRLSEAIAENPPVCSEPDYRDLFFFEYHASGRPIYELEVKARNKEAEAKIICNFCPVKALCAEYSILADEPYGVWGGITASERRAISSARSNMPGLITAR